MLQNISVTARKLAQSIGGRQRAGAAWAEWASTADLCPRRFWVHAPSVGEALVADPVVARLVKSHVEPVTVIKTYTSPSAAAWRHGFQYHRSDYLPSSGALPVLFRTLRPSLIIYPRADLWPALVSLASDAGVPQVVIGGLLRDDSRRLRWPGRLITRSMVRSLTAIGAVSKRDQRRWRDIGASSDQIVITGDPRDTQVIDRPNDVRLINRISEWVDRDFVLLAGSTHATDDVHVVEAAVRLPGRTIIVPHDVTIHGIARLATMCERKGLSHSVLSDRAIPRDTRVLVVGVHGHLQDLYLTASVALVGGGFAGNRVHSVLEPAAFGVPMLVGPGGASDPSTQRFLAKAAARIVSSADDIVKWCTEWCDDGARMEAGLRARAVLDGGAATKTVELIRRAVE